MKNLPEKTVDAKNAKAVKGGGISLSYSQIQQEYKEQK
jgi:hypothetical protein